MGGLIIYNQYMRYELFYLIGASREADVEKIKGDIEKLVKDASGEFEEKETLEKRKLAYQIKHETHGIFIAQRFELDSEKIAGLSKKINLYPNIIRFIVSRASELPELKSKEERISEATAKPAPIREERKKEEKENVQIKKKSEAKEEKTPAKEDDIDKKLEEILNI